MPNDWNETDANYRAARYFIAQSVGVCQHCGQATPLFALGLAPGHLTLESQDDASEPIAQEQLAELDSWNVARHLALLFHVAYLPFAVQRRLADLAPSYRPEPEPHDDEGCWSNHCAHCDEPWDDNELFCEPGGAFLPMSEAEGRRIDLLMINEVFEAGAAGYACEPEYFDFVVRS